MNNPSAIDTLQSKKRPRAESTCKSKVEPGDLNGFSEPVMKEEGIPTPAYGSQEYWEKRYENATNKNSSNKNDDPDPYHAWYFKFEDLAPIILPLILGSDSSKDCDDNPEESEEGDSSDDSRKKVSNKNKANFPQVIGDPTCNKGRTNPQINNDKLESIDVIKRKSKNQDIEQTNNIFKFDEGRDTESDTDIENFEVIEIEEDEEDTNSEIIRPGLAKNGPISVLEIGCGDAPLGQDLAFSIQKYGIQSNRDPSKIIKKIVCLDYSHNVIDTMKRRQKRKLLPSEEKQLSVCFEAADARELFYRNESFEIILEKGTLDAMLSDSDGQGQQNCQNIVTECARVLTIGGYIVIISHLNAHTESGLGWLNNIIVPGLSATGNFEWLIEVHGRDVEIPSDDENETEGNNERQIESPGPAVYFIEKVRAFQQTTLDKDGEQPSPTIPLKFFSY